VFFCFYFGSKKEAKNVFLLISLKYFFESQTKFLGLKKNWQINKIFFKKAY
jgi:hypothetical protein